MGVFRSNLDLNTAGEKPSSSVFVEILVWCTRFPFASWTVHSTSISSLLLNYDVSKISVESAEGRNTSLSDYFKSISTLTNTKLQEMKEICKFSQFSTSSPANSLPVYRTLLRQNEHSEAQKTEILFFCLYFFFYRDWFVHMINYSTTQKKIRVMGTLKEE